MLWHREMLPKIPVLFWERVNPVDSEHFLERRHEGDIHVMTLHFIFQKNLGNTNWICSGYTRKVFDYGLLLFKRLDPTQTKHCSSPVSTKICSMIWGSSSSSQLQVFFLLCQQTSSTSFLAAIISIGFSQRPTEEGLFIWTRNLFLGVMGERW